MKILQYYVSFSERRLGLPRVSCDCGRNTGMIKIKTIVIRGTKGGHSDKPTMVLGEVE